MAILKVNIFIQILSQAKDALDENIELAASLSPASKIELAASLSPAYSSIKTRLNLSLSLAGADWLSKLKSDSESFIFLLVKFSYIILLFSCLKIVSWMEN